jgi:ABC-type transport system substrate-binding protein
MATRSGAVLTSGTASAAKFVVAALAFAAAYAGLSAYGTASSAPAPARAAAPVTLTAQETPVTTEPTARAVAAGTVAVSALPAEPGCLKTFVARTVLVNPEAGETLSYSWKLARWSPAAKTWRTYLVDYNGFAGARDTAEWEATISGNPGWYRVELAVDGGRTIKSDRFQVSC